MHNIKGSFVGCLLVLSGGMFTHTAVAQHLDIQSGVDSNPLLSPNEDEIAQYSSVNAKGDLGLMITDRHRLYIEADGHGDFYSGDFSDANRWDARVSLGVDSTERNEEWLHLKSHLRMDAQVYRRTYFDRATGLIQTFADEEIGERFDRNLGRIGVSLDARPFDLFRLRLDALGEQVDYVEDYELLGLPKLDHRNAAAEVAIRFDFFETLGIEFAAPYERRFFEDKRSRDANGLELVDSDLEYEQFGGEVRLTWQPNSRWRAVASGGTDKRTDNGGGYYDATYLRYAFHLRYDTRHQSARLALLRNERQYDTRVIEDVLVNEEEDLSRDSWRVSLRYEHRFPGLDEFPLFLFGEASYITTENLNPLFAYDRALFQLGVSLND